MNLYHRMASTSFTIGAGETSKIAPELHFGLSSGSNDFNVTDDCCGNDDTCENEEYELVIRGSRELLEEAAIHLYAHYPSLSIGAEDDYVSEGDDLHIVDEGPVSYGEPTNFEIYDNYVDKVCLLCCDQLITFGIPEGSTSHDLVTLLEAALDTRELLVDFKVDVQTTSGDWFPLWRLLNAPPVLLSGMCLHNRLYLRASCSVRGGMPKRKVVIKQPKKKGPQRKDAQRRQKAQDKSQTRMFAINLPEPEKAPKKRVRGPNLVIRGVSVSECVRQWFAATVDPFSVRNVCLPTIPALASLKASGFIRFTMSGASGVGSFVTINPSWLSDASQGVVTTSSFAPVNTSFPVSYLNGAGTALQAGASFWTCSSLPYSSAQLNFVGGSNGSALSNGNLIGRVCSAGLRCTYTGQTLNTSGVYYCYVDQAHEGALGTTILGTNIGSLLQTDVVGVSRESCVLSVYPINEFEMGYSNPSPTTDDVTSAGQVLGAVAYPLSVSSGFITPYASSSGGYSGTQFFAPISGPLAGTGSTIIFPEPVGIIYATNSAAASYLIEAIVHVEYAGPAVAALATPNVADPEGLSRAISVLQQIPVAKQANPHGTVREHITSALKEVATKLRPVAISALVTGAKMAASSLGFM